MIQKIVTIILIFFTVGIAFSQEKELKVFFDESQFYTPESGNYIEVKLNFMGYSLSYVTEDNRSYAAVEITQIFSQNDSIVLADRYLLNGPEVVDSVVENFYDIQRYPLLAGRYHYFLSIQDVNSKKEPLSLSKNITIKERADGLSLSSFVPAETIVPNPDEVSTFTKVGYDVVPMFGSYYPTEVENLLYYFEIYNTDKYLEDTVYIVEQKLVGKDNTMNLEEYTRYFRYKNSVIQPVSKVIDISGLPTGAYTLELNTLNRNKEVIAQIVYDFDRNNTDKANELAYSNVILDPEFEKSIPKDSSGYYVASLIPISRQAEVKNIIRLLKEKDREKNFQYLQAFWIHFDSKDPYQAWIKYKAQVQLVERLYATNYQVGFETDRGRVYLAYGSPNSIIEEPSSPSEYPYEIWQYDKINQYSNRRFVFYNPTNIGKDYRLLHSDMIGEIQNYRWKYALNKRNTPDMNLDDPTGGATPHFGGRSSLYFDSY